MILENLQKNNNITVAVFINELGGYYTGRATPRLLESVKVPCYGDTMSLDACALVSVKSHDMLIVRPWDPTLLPSIEKAIHAANLGLNPQADSEVVKVYLPQRTKENDIKIFKLIKDRGEQAKISIRVNRKNARNKIKELPDNERMQLENEIQKETDQRIEKISNVLSAKKKDMKV